MKLRAIRFVASLVVLALLAGAAVAQPVLRFTEDLEDERPEAWAMAYYTSVALLTGLGAPRDMEPGAVEIGFEGGWVPSLSERERRVGFEGIKLEDLNKTSVFGRPRVTVGLPRRFSVTVAYAPPIDVGGVEPNLLAASINRPILEKGSWRFGLRLFAQVGTIKGDLTCDAATAAADDPQRNPFGCAEASRDEVTQNYLGVELSAARELADSRLEPHFGLALSRLDNEFQVDARYLGFIDNNRLLSDPLTWSIAAGLSLNASERLRLTGEVFYTPLDVVRPPSTGSENDPLVNLRAAISYRVR